MQMLKKLLSDKISNTKECLLFSFLSSAPTHQSLTFNLRFLCELKHKVCLSKTLCGMWGFPCLILIRVFESLYLWSTKCIDSLTSKHHNSFQNESNRKASQNFASAALI